MSREHILANVDLLPSPPVAIEALWDGDTNGWFLCLAAITADAQTHALGVLSDGGDIRLFNGHVPPWPEAVVAKQLGEELTERFGAEFYFPSPHHPEDDCPPWQERHKGYPCRRCGIRLLQRHDCRLYGICYQCFLKEDREDREAQWTPEQRAAPRCHLCGNPATDVIDGDPACAECVANYEVYICANCAAVTVLLKTLGHTALCSQCELHKPIDSLSDTQRTTIRNALADGRLAGVKTAMDIVGCSLHEAEYIVRVLSAAERPTS